MTIAVFYILSSTRKKRDGELNESLIAKAYLRLLLLQNVHQSKKFF